MLSTFSSSFYFGKRSVKFETFSRLFTGGQAPGANTETAWNTYRASLTGTYRTFRITSSLGSSITVTDSANVQILANGLRTGSNTSVVIGSTTWLIGRGCGTPLTGGTAIEICNNARCSNTATFALRPQINNGNWGGAGGVTINAPTQTLTLTFF